MSSIAIPQFSPSRLQAVIAASGQTKTDVVRRLWANETSGMNTLRDYLNGRRKPTLENVYKLANALGVDPTELCER